MFVLHPLVFLALAILAFWSRWAYVVFVLLALLFFPARVGFHLQPSACELTLDVPLALFSLTNWKHILLFAWFFIVSRAQFRTSLTSALLWATVSTMAMGIAVEAGEGMTGMGHCRLRDLVPDVAGTVVGAALVFIWTSLRGARNPAPSP